MNGFYVGFTNLDRLPKLLKQDDEWLELLHEHCWVQIEIGRKATTDKIYQVIATMCRLDFFRADRVLGLKVFSFGFVACS